MLKTIYIEIGLGQQTLTHNMNTTYQSYFHDIEQFAAQTGHALYFVNNNECQFIYSESGMPKISRNHKGPIRTVWTQGKTRPAQRVVRP